MTASVSISHVATLGQGDDIRFATISDLHIQSWGGEVRVHVAAAAYGTLTTLRLASDAAATISATSVLPATGVSELAAPWRLATVDFGGTTRLLVTGQTGSAIASYGYDAQGLPTGQALLAVTGPGPSAMVAAVTMESEAFLYAASQSGPVSGYRILGGTLEPLGPAATLAISPQQGVSLLAPLTVGAARYLVAASPGSDSVAAYRVDALGALSMTASSGAYLGLGMSTPTALVSAQVAGRSYAIVAAAGSSSLTVFEMRPDGRLSATDHVVDTLASRFAGVLALETIAIGDRVFVLAGGADQGISILLLLPTGRLLPLTHLADNGALSLANVSALSAVVIDGMAHIFAAGPAETGVTQLRLNLGALAPMIIGGGGDETLSGGAANDLISGGAGNDRLFGGGGADLLIDGPGSDTLTGGSGADIFVLVADGDPDHITDFRPGTDRLDLTAWGPIYGVEDISVQTTATGATLSHGTEVLHIVTAQAVPLTAQQINAALIGDVHHLATGVLARTTIIMGTEAADTLAGGAMGEEIAGLGGADSILGGDGDDVLLGGSGSDTLRGEGGDDVLDGGGHNDLLFGGSGNDTLEGGWGHDSLFGGAGDDRLFGGIGQDILYGNEGADYMDGGEESDLYYVDALDTLHDSGTTGYDVAQIFDAAGVALNIGGWTGIERVAGFTGADRIDATGSSSPWVLLGGDGADTLIGGAGDDTLLGGAGDDELRGGSGNNVMQGGTGNDTFWGGAGDDIFYVGEAGDVVADGGGGFDRVVVNTAAGLSLSVGGWLSVERFVGWTGNDTIDATGATWDLALLGGDGADVLTGGAGNDAVYGGNGADVLRGGAGDDALIGGAGDDRLEGGAGNDFLLGGAGADVFVFAAGWGADAVRDWQDGQDRIDFAGHAGVTGLGDLLVVQDGAHTVISLAAGGPDSITLLDIQATLIAADDFVFV